RASQCTGPMAMTHTEFGTTKSSARSVGWEWSSFPIRQKSGMRLSWRIAYGSVALEIKSLFMIRHPTEADRSSTSRSFRNRCGLSQAKVQITDKLPHVTHD